MLPEIINDSGAEAGDSSSEENSSNSYLFGKYELGKLLGVGAFGKVYHSRNVETGQAVAIKAISKQKVVKGGQVANIKREISIMRRLRHPNIVKLFEVLATKTKIYFVMEFAKGGELFGKVAKGRFSEDLSRRYFQQLISAVGYCHSRGVFHRDLKPENLLLDENWNLKVSDFGLSALKEQIRPDGRLHTLCGTPAYVAPEILAKKGYDGAKVDVWSCGVILFVLNAGYLPFNDTNLMALYKKIYRGQFRCPKWTSPNLKRFLSRLLDTNPDTRITVDEIINDPWFKEGFKDVKFYEEEGFDTLKFEEGDDDNDRLVNAFDLISYSSGFNLSGLFHDSGVPADCGEIFASAESPEKVIAEIEAAARKLEDVAVVVSKRVDWGLRLEGQNGNFVIVIEVHRLTEKLVVVEVRKRERDVEPAQGFWKDKLRPMISGLIYQTDSPITGVESRAFIVQ